MENKKKVLVVVLANTETHEGKGRVTNALMMVRELQEANHEVKLLFDGAGVESFAEMKDEDNEFHDMYKKVEHNVAGGCSFCAQAFGVSDDLDDDDLLSEYHEHQSFAKYVKDGYQIVNF